MMTESGFLDFVREHPSQQVLDVATGHGGFILSLQQWFPDAQRYVGIDALPRAIEHAKSENGTFERTEFLEMDAHHLEFDDGSFDVIGISNSIHHLAAPEKALQEMIRVLKKKGVLLIYEMVNDSQSETQMTHVLFHHWWAKIDSQLGVSHFPTYSRIELVSLFQSTGIELVDMLEENALESSPTASEDHERFHVNYQNYLTRAKDLSDYAELEAEGTILLERLNRIGVHPATELMLIGIK